MNKIITEFVYPVFFISTVVLGLGCTAMGTIDISPEELKKKYGTDEDEYLELGGMEVRYRDEGEGPAVVLLHGVCASLETWDGWTEKMKENYRVIRIDIPGFGLTGPAPDKSQYKIENSVEFLDEFVSHLGIDEFYLVGNSLGGYISWNYSLKYPHKVKKMILIDSVGYPQKMPRMLRYASNPLVRSTSRKMMPRSMLYKSVKQVYGDKSKVTPKVQERYFDFAMREGNKGSYVDIFVEFRDNEDVDISKGISKIKVPVMVMWGTKDEWIPFEAFEKFKKDLPSAQYVAYEGVGHIPMEEIPEESVRDAMGFLQ